MALTASAWADTATQAVASVLPRSGSLLRAVAALLCLTGATTTVSAQQSLPEAPSALLWSMAAPASGLANASPAQTTSPTRGRRCSRSRRTESPEADASAEALPPDAGPCVVENPIQSVVTRPVTPLTPMGKAQLAVRDFDDPFNFITIAGYSGLAVASNAHSAFGPGFAGWGRLTGYSLLEDAQGEFVGTFLVVGQFERQSCAGGGIVLVQRLSLY